LFGFAAQAQTDVYQGYLVTKNNFRLTGYIGSMDIDERGTQIKFVNDFGTPYKIYPALIKGFVYYQGPMMQAYESKFYRNHWMFLSVEYAGENVRLLKTPDKQNIYSRSINREVKRYWLETPTLGVIPIPRLGFRRYMRKIIGDVSPELAQKIGKKGYRFKNLYEIMAAFDAESGRDKRRL
jgi:hypothetical protein